MFHAIPSRINKSKNPQKTNAMHSKWVSPSTSLSLSLPLSLPLSVWLSLLSVVVAHANCVWFFIALQLCRCCRLKCWKRANSNANSTPRRGLQKPNNNNYNNNGGNNNNVKHLNRFGFFRFLKIEPQIENQDEERKGNHNEKKWVTASIENCTQTGGLPHTLSHTKTHTLRLAAVCCESEIEFLCCLMRSSKKTHQKCS